MPILTLTTDWGLRDHYLATFKGGLLCMLPSLQMIDISHEVEKYNTMQAAFIIQNSFRKFPDGSIHFISVSGNENCSCKNPYLIVKTNGHYLLGEDNGIFSLILGKNEREIFRLPITAQTGRNELHQAFLNTIKSIVDGTEINQLGNPDNEIIESYFALPTVDNQTIRGTIIYFDSFGNAVVNITKELFSQEKKGRNFVIHFRKAIYNVKQISNNYEDVDVGEMVALFNQDGFLEISLNKESANKLLGLKLMDTIRIEFDDNTSG